MGVEIERKFLVADREAAVAAAERSEEIRQGYVALDPDVEVRVRRIGERRVITVKGGRGEVRRELELEIDAAAFDELWELTEGRRVSKRRHHVPGAGDLVGEVDVYAAELDGLCPVEVEFADEEASAAFSPPAWFGRELTGDDRYANRSLAVDGLPG
jgi:CYTH domain-containing protein